ncbi:MAG: hypothetical protein EA383_09125 [Spirochaetaceae bacterium]|nr:MAG: hypothetical protein EA383_09125 [Spirochaetaceae bacterium]
MATAPTYYEILGVQTECSQDDLKKAFRKRAKELHPDLAGGNEQSAASRMRTLLRAYETLADPERRAVYDRTHYIAAQKYRFDYREFLKARVGDLDSQSKLIFFDLLHSREQDAVELFSSLCAKKTFDLQNHLDREDYMDCVFLLAEEYESRGNFLQAYALLKRLVRCEAERPYFRHFIDEIIEKLKNITCFRMIERETTEVVLDCLEELISFNFSRKDTAFFLKKAAEIYSDREDYDRAIRYLERALELDDKMTGIKKLKQRIGYLESF